LTAAPEACKSADGVIAALRGVGADLSYDRDSVAWIDAYIERNREHYTVEEATKVANNLGVFVDECLRVAHGLRRILPASKHDGASIGPNSDGCSMPGVFNVSPQGHGRGLGHVGHCRLALNTPPSAQAAAPGRVACRPRNHE
jgi:hypothetical protein